MHAAIDELARAFSQAFGVPAPRPFGSANSRHRGFSDDARGVQWNAGVDTTRGVLTVGVNLEGMEYDRWPIARFIASERSDGAFTTFCSSYEHASAAELWFSRDAWQASYRPPIVEQDLTSTVPVLLHNLSPELWKAALDEARRCLLHDSGGRVEASVTLVSTQRQVKRWVSPHLQIKTIVRAHPGQDLTTALRQASQRLRPVYDYVAERAAVR